MISGRVSYQEIKVIAKSDFSLSMVSFCTKFYFITLKRDQETVLPNLHLIVLNSHSSYSATEFDFIPDYLTDILKTYDRKIIPSEHQETTNVCTSACY